MIWCAMGADDEKIGVAVFDLMGLGLKRAAFRVVDLGAAEFDSF